MKKPTIGTTRYGNAIELNKRAVEALTFIIKTRLASPQIVLSKVDQDAIYSLKIHTRSIFTDILTRVISEDKLSSCTFFNLGNIPGISIPEMFSNVDLVIDGKYVSSNIPKEYQTAWLNLTPILSKRDAYNSGLWITDIPVFAGQITKAMLCLSYNDSDQWLTPQLCVFVIKSYSLMLGSMLGNFYNLDFAERRLVQTVFAAYMAQMVGPAGAPTDIPPLLNRCGFLGTPEEIKARMSLFTEVREAESMQQLSIANCCRMLSVAGPARMKAVEENKIYVPMSRAPGDSQNMLVAIDYPPFWVFQILANLKASKNPMFTNMMENADLRREVMTFGRELASSKQFINKVNR